MRFHLIVVGRMRRGIESNLFEHYRKRIRWPLDVREIDGRRGTGNNRDREGAAILSAMPDDTLVVALDERGCDLASEVFARKVAEWRNSGIVNIAFVIGGADGLSEDVRRRADLLFAFGSATWPHLLVRGMLVEQLYRVQQILSGHPYHRA
ncbi:MAG: Ribosomal RNA large subunit methyltransferase H [Alphaproteobacteria bacterium MarineAlpha4_Bin2]|nr:MAG: Ribosomal RNA large subunit methyltransferase H [Alphaproteobacteria bacterium MarineAlpha4_Bin2]